MKFPDIELERSLWNQGFTYVVGLDEAGRGPLAGPVLAGAAVIDADSRLIEKVRDSKKMTQKQRQESFMQLVECLVGWGVGVVSAAEIDSLGIQDAVQKAMTDALKMLESQINSQADYIIADGLGILPIEGYKMKKIKEGDGLHYSISAASVLAKVQRDKLMYEYAQQYPEYGFESHVGYGTKQHIEALHKYGPCEIHRKTFRPVSELV